MNVLALETATDACSVALAAGEDLYSRQSTEPRIHARRVLAMVDECLAEAGQRPADVDLLVFGRGPGSFTGVRIATGVVQGLSLGAGLPVVPVSTLAALAQGTIRQQGARAVLAALDARMQEVYWGAFRCDDNGLVDPLGGEAVCAPQRVPLPAAGRRRTDGRGRAPDRSGTGGCPRPGGGRPGRLPGPGRGVQRVLDQGAPHRAGLGQLAARELAVSLGMSDLFLAGRLERTP